MAIKAINLHEKPTRKVGFLLKPHGYKGHIKLSISDDDFKPSDFLLININQKYVPFKIEHINADCTIVKLKDINSIEAIGIYNGMDVVDFIDENKVEGINYADYTLIDNETKQEFAILQIVVMPNQMLIEFRNGFKDSLLPFHDDLIVEVNDDKKYIIANIPDGILDL